MSGYKERTMEQLMISANRLYRQIEVKDKERTQLQKEYDRVMEELRTRKHK